VESEVGKPVLKTACGICQHILYIWQHLGTIWLLLPQCQKKLPWPAWPWLASSCLSLRSHRNSDQHFRSLGLPGSRTSCHKIGALWLQWNICIWQWGQLSRLQLGQGNQGMISVAVKFAMHFANTTVPEDVAMEEEFR
jgi:hypothetical protein